MCEISMVTWCNRTLGVVRGAMLGVSISDHVSSLSSTQEVHGQGGALDCCVLLKVEKHCVLELKREKPTVVCYSTTAHILIVCVGVSCVCVEGDGLCVCILEGCVCITRNTAACALEASDSLTLTLHQARTHAHTHTIHTHTISLSHTL
jgi:hypothetical protein